LKETAVVRECFSAFVHHGFTVLMPGWRTPYEVEARKGVIWRNNVGGMRDKTGRHFVRYGVNGSPDIFGFTGGGRAMGFEVKKPGETPTELQRWFGRLLINAGGLWGWGDSYAKCDAWLKETGL
jgi:hypothetical protein